MRVFSWEPMSPFGSKSDRLLQPPSASSRTGQSRRAASEEYLLVTGHLAMRRTVRAGARRATLRKEGRGGCHASPGSHRLRTG